MTPCLLQICVFFLLLLACGYLVLDLDWLLRKVTKQTQEAFLLGKDPLNEDAHVLVVQKARAVKDEFDQTDNSKVDERVEEWVGVGAMRFDAVLSETAIKIETFCDAVRF